MKATSISNFVHNGKFYPIGTKVTGLDKKELLALENADLVCIENSADSDIPPSEDSNKGAPPNADADSQIDNEDAPRKRGKRDKSQE